MGSNHVSAFLVVLARALCAVALMSLIHGYVPQVNSAESYTSFLPLVARDRTGIQGRVVEHGQPVGGVALQLRFFNGAGWTTLRTTTTGSDGQYAFENIPTLGSGQAYYVRYDNDGNQNRLRAWLTETVTQYTWGSYKRLGQFDVGDILLGVPSSGAYVELPCTFAWNGWWLRAPTDVTYEFNIYEWRTGNPWAYRNVGYVSDFTVTSLPPGFIYEAWYIWEIWVYEASGGFGISRNANSVLFRAYDGHQCASAARAEPSDTAPVLALTARPSLSPWLESEIPRPGVAPGSAAPYPVQRGE